MWSHFEQFEARMSQEEPGGAMMWQNDQAIVNQQPANYRRQLKAFIGFRRHLR